MNSDRDVPGDERAIRPARGVPHSGTPRALVWPRTDGLLRRALAPAASRTVTGARRSRVVPPSAPGAAPPPVEPMVVARSRHITLRTFVPGDLQYLSEWAEDPFLERMVGSEFLHAYTHVYDKDPSFYDAVLNDPTQVVFMIEAVRGWTRPVGLIRLFNIHLLEGYAYIEAIVADQKALRRGFGVQACRLISYYGIDVLGLRRIEAKVYEYNALSVNTLKRNGCVQEGVLRKAAFKDGRYWDVLVFGILREEIEAVRRRDKYLPSGGGPVDAP
jgi:RimJ/RimL family protein N-acetyltransferase